MITSVVVAAEVIGMKRPVTLADILRALDRARPSGPSPGTRTATAITSLPTSTAAHR